MNTQPTTGEPVINMGLLADEWEGMRIRIRPFLSFKASRLIDTAAVSMGNVSEDGIDLSMNPMNHAVAVVEQCVLSWTLKNHADEIIASTREGVEDDLTPAVLMEEAVEAILEYYESAAPKVRTGSA